MNTAMREPDIGKLKASISGRVLVARQDITAFLTDWR